MESNREDDPSMLRKIAEAKMLAGDFVGAHKVITKAQRLFPNLDNILKKISTICDVHSSAIKKIKKLENWYGILQVKPFADADTIKKQYRKLALLLHPDKNKFAGAESAFKLIEEASRMLSDHKKRSQYDIRYRKKLGLIRHCDAATSSNVSSLYTFWTRCKHCGYLYNYLRLYMNEVLFCSSCRKSFLAINMRFDEVSPCSSTATRTDSASSAADVLKPQHEVKESVTSAAKSIPDISALKKKSAKKRRKAVEVAEAKTDTSEYNKKKSSRKKPHASYTKRGRDGDFVSTTKSGCEFESGFNRKQTAEKHKSPELADSGVSSASSHGYKGKAKENANSGNKDKLSDKNKESAGCDGNGEDAESDRVQNGYKANDVFEVERKIGNFAVDQVWSTTDPRDGMPRRYAQITKVLNAELKLQITYLEPERDGYDDDNIPVACGKFRNGKTVEVEDHSIFSSQMHHLVCNKDVFIYPRKGEIWALFKDWDEEWSINLKKHNLPYRYVFVEVVNDFHSVDGVGVAYLGKLEGSAPLFHLEALNEVCQIQFRAEEIRRFSHKVPAVKMTGKERDCVSTNSYKLDPAALPKHIFQVDGTVLETGPSTRKRRKCGDDNFVCSNLEEVKGETSRSSDLSSCQVDDKNTAKLSRKNVFKLRKSPRFHTISSQQRNEKKSVKQGTVKKTDKGLVTDDSLGGTNGEIPSLSMEKNLASSNCKRPRRNAFDFKKQRSEDRFQVDQIWAVYSKNMGIPSEYVKIRKVETKHEFLLRVTQTELYPPGTETLTYSLSCGEFKLKNGRPRIFHRASFSHQVKPFDSEKKFIVKVYPRKGEIWALYKNCDRTKEEHDIVLVVEDDCDGKILKVVALTPKDSTSLYMTQKKQEGDFIDIPKAEMSRFSHQIPAVKHEKRRTRLVEEEGYWELDPIAIPGRTIVID